MAFPRVPLLVAIYLVAVMLFHAWDLASAEQIQLVNILPKLRAIHEDAQSLLIRNGELKAKILVGLQAQTEFKVKLAKESKLAGLGGSQKLPAGGDPQVLVVESDHNQKQKIIGQANSDTRIDYAELEEFNKWVDTNLEYAVKNTQASIEALKEEAQQGNGLVDYSEQAVKDGIEGVKYWQMAVIFQDKTLKNEKFDVKIE